MPSFFRTPIGLSIEEVERSRTLNGIYKNTSKMRYVPLQILNSFFSLFNLVIYSLIFALSFFGEFTNITFLALISFSYSLLLLFQKLKYFKSIEKSENGSLNYQYVSRQIGQRNQVVNLPLNQIVIGDMIFLDGEAQILFNGEIVASDCAEFNESIVNGRSDLIQKAQHDDVFANSIQISGRCFYKVTSLKRDHNFKNLDILLVFKDLTNGVRYLLYALLFILAIILIFNFELTASEDGNTNFSAVITSVVPQCLLLVYIISLILSFIKANKNNILIKRFNSLESLSYSDILCIDKTGTLTKNKLRVKYIFPLDQKTKERDILLLASLVNNLSDKNKSVIALQEYLKDIPGYSILKKRKEIPSTTERKASICVFDDFSLIMGDPSILLPLNHPLLKNVDKFRLESFRVFVFGSYGDDKKFNPLSLIVIEDAVRDEIADELLKLTKNPIQLKILSGDLDFPVVAISYKLQNGFDSKSMSGEELSNLNEVEFERASMIHNIFSRLSQFQKKAIVSVLRKKSLNITMLGDGYNDIEALKESNLAMTMAESPVAIKKSSDLIFGDNTFSYLGELYTEGKLLNTKVTNIFSLYLCKNFSLVFIVAFTSLIGFGYLFDPKQIALANFLILEIPSFILAFTEKSQKRMVFSKVIIKSFKISVMNILALLSCFAILKLENISTNSMRSTLLVLSIILGIVNILLIYNDKYSLKAMLNDELVILSVGGIFAFLISDLLIPVIRDFFGVIELSFLNLLIVVVIAIFGFIAYILASDMNKAQFLYNQFRGLEKKRRFKPQI